MTLLEELRGESGFLASKKLICRSMTNLVRDVLQLLENVEQVRAIALEDRRRIIEVISELPGVTWSSEQRNLSEDNAIIWELKSAQHQ